MREISTQKRIKVIKLFLTGLSYDEIARQVGIAKGSVVHIINEFREGYLLVPPDMTEYVDALRQVAVDLRKNNTSITQVKSCLRLDAKLKEMGVSNEESEQCLDICQDIASPTASTGQFVAAALELARLEAENGLTYGEVIADYNEKLKRSAEMDTEIVKKNEQLSEVVFKHKQEKEQATSELNSITKAIATAQDVFRKQKNDLKSQLNEYLARNKLSWKKVNIVLALLDRALDKSCLTQREINHLTNRINYTGSLVNVIKQSEGEKDGLQSEVDELARKKQTYSSSVRELKSIDDNLQKSIYKNTQELDRFNSEVRTKLVELAALKETTSRYTHNLYVARLIIDFLFAPGSLSDYDLDRLVSHMIGLRQKRLGIEPKQVKDASGNVICECQVPRTSSTVRLSEKDIDNVRAEFAQMLSPLVKDKLVSRFDYDMAVMKCESEKQMAYLRGTMEERNRKGPFGNASRPVSS